MENSVNKITDYSYKIIIIVIIVSIVLIIVSIIGIIISIFVIIVSIIVIIVSIIVIIASMIVIIGLKILLISYYAETKGTTTPNGYSSYQDKTFFHSSELSCET